MEEEENEDGNWVCLGICLVSLVAHRVEMES